LEIGILRAISAIVGDSTASGASLLRAFGAGCACALSVDILRWDPGATVSSRAIHAVSCWDRPFSFSFLILRLHSNVNMWHDLTRWDRVETALDRPLGFAF
jgi:hypothetical protein